MLSRHPVIALDPGYDCLLDAEQRGAVFCADPAVQAFLAGGGLLACGIVPTLRDLTDVPFAALLVRWLVVSCGGDSCAPLKSHTPITATCGLGLLTEGAARRSFQGGPRAGGDRCVHTLPDDGEAGQDQAVGPMGLLHTLGLTGLRFTGSYLGGSDGRASASMPEGGYFQV